MIILFNFLTDYKLPQQETPVGMLTTFQSFLLNRPNYPYPNNVKYEKVGHFLLIICERDHWYIYNFWSAITTTN